MFHSGGSLSRVLSSAPLLSGAPAEELTEMVSETETHDFIEFIQCWGVLCMVSLLPPKRSGGSLTRVRKNSTRKPTSSFIHGEAAASRASSPTSFLPS